MTIQTKRIYTTPAKADGLRLLVDRLWPRGMKKESAQIDAWVKEIAPSHELRKGRSSAFMSSIKLSRV